ncbi:MAG: AAA family ATPase [Patescibacteria group bacterium]
MRLTSLELSGFKSFARKTVLEFPHPITAIVGPNGSGKSNVKEAIQWVLGEQSLKSLRGKKGEDLIWNGSPLVPRMGKASAVLAFDNSLGRIPLDFEEVRVGRRIFRDGTGEYLLNDSLVRLKDVAELAAGMGLGQTQHNIIGQGEVDRMLLASPRDRKAMIEEALGLRVYHLKREDAARRMSQTEENMERVRGLIREIAPYLKFLREQAKKAGMRRDLETELARCRMSYYASAVSRLERDNRAFEVRYGPAESRRAEAEGEIAAERDALKHFEKALAAEGGDGLLESEKKRLESRRQILERDLGRLEARLELEREKLNVPLLIPVDGAYIADELTGIIRDAEAMTGGEMGEGALRTAFRDFIGRVCSTVENIRRGSVEARRPPEETDALKDLERVLGNAQEEYRTVARRLEECAASEKEERMRRDALRENIRLSEARLRDRQSALRDIEYRLASRSAERIALEARRKRLMILKKEYGLEGRDVPDAGAGDVAPEEWEKKMERVRVKLEEIGGIDPETLREHVETEERHAFLTGELDDLTRANASLKEVMRELDRRIREEFRKGFSQIKDAFHEYFRIIFGGGRASLQLVRIGPRFDGAGVEGADQGSGEVSVSAADDRDEGVEISVNLPAKRIKGLAMLSGGERALAAIALLFATSAVNPPPFLILDETDAALDEANTRRYADILRKLSKKTQLILVTHNRETMKAAGVLYGVTMGNDGISKLLSLKFEDAEAYASR